MTQIVPVAFHPSYPDLWQISLFGSGATDNGNGIQSIKLQDEKPRDPDNKELSLQAARNLLVTGGVQLLSVQHRIRLERLEFQKGIRLLAGQTFQAQPYGQAWLKTAKGYYLPLFASRTAVAAGGEALSNDHHQELLVAKPFWPAYRVMSGISGSSSDDNSNNDGRGGGVAPYICSMEDLLVDETCEDCAVLAWKDYNVSSPFRAPDLTKYVGYVFMYPEVPLKGGAVDVKKCPWWTHDGKVWWPKSVSSHELLGKKLPQKLACIKVPPKSIMSHAVMISSDYVRFCFFDRGHLLILLIVTEYLMIIVGVLAGLEFGWTVALQLIYLLCLVLLALVEISFVGNWLPNGFLWMKLNFVEILKAVLRSSLGRWDLYSDVGVAVMMYQNATSKSLWIGSTIAAALSVSLRLPYSLYYAGSLSKEVNVKNLANVAAPAYMKLFCFLCEMMANTEGTNVRKVTVTTELWFESFIFICLGIPEIILQAVYIFVDGANTCADCAKGFVMVSFLISIVTAPRLTFIAYRKYVNVSASIARKNNCEELAPTKSKKVSHNQKLVNQGPTYPDTIAI